MTTQMDKIFVVGSTMWGERPSEFGCTDHPEWDPYIECKDLNPTIPEILAQAEAHLRDAHDA